MVLSAQFSPDGGKIVSASGDKTMRVQSAVTGGCELMLEGHSGPLFSSQFSPGVVSKDSSLMVSVQVVVQIELVVNRPPWWRSRCDSGSR